MLSVEQCKKFLVENNYENQEVEEIKDCLYQIAELIITDYMELKKEG